MLYKNLWRWSTNYRVCQWLRPLCRAWNWENYKVAIWQIETKIHSQKKFSLSQILVNLLGKKCGISIGYKNLWRWSTNYLVFQWLRPPCRAWNWVNYKVAILQIEAKIQSQKKFSWSQILVNLLGKKCGISFGPHHAKRARMTWHLISSNLHWKSSAKNGGSNWVLIQGVIFTVSIIISGLLSLPSCYLENEALRQKSLKLKMDKICCPGPFHMTQPICEFMPYIHFSVAELKKLKLLMRLYQS